jgi:hypothetical protein
MKPRTARIALALLLLLSTPALAAGVERKFLSVAGDNDDYTPAVEVRKGDLILIAASGSVNTEQRGPTSADGHGAGCRCDDSDGSLQHKIGSSAAMPTGQNKVFVSVSNGLLKFKVRDTKYNDNTGSFSVVVTRIPGNVAAAHQKLVAVEAANDESRQLRWTFNTTEIEL